MLGTTAQTVEPMKIEISQDFNADEIGTPAISRKDARHHSRPAHAKRKRRRTKFLKIHSEDDSRRQEKRRQTKPQHAFAHGGGAR